MATEQGSGTASPKDGLHEVGTAGKASSQALGTGEVQRPSASPGAATGARSVRLPAPPARTPDPSSLGQKKGGDPPDALAQSDKKTFQQQRRTAVFAAMLVLMEKGADSQDDLVRLTLPMSDEELLQVAEERALAGE